jgi:hypothetical protein
MQVIRNEDENKEKSSMLAQTEISTFMKNYSEHNDLLGRLLKKSYI